MAAETVLVVKRKGVAIRTRNGSRRVRKGHWLGEGIVHRMVRKTMSMGMRMRMVEASCRRRRRMGKGVVAVERRVRVVSVHDRLLGLERSCGVHDVRVVVGGKSR